MNKTSQTIPEILHVSDEDEAVLCPRESHIESLSVLQEADAGPGPHTGDDDDVPLTALEDKQVWTFTACSYDLTWKASTVLTLISSWQLSFSFWS